MDLYFSWPETWKGLTFAFDWISECVHKINHVNVISKTEESRGHDKLISSGIQTFKLWPFREGTFSNFKADQLPELLIYFTPQWSGLSHSKTGPQSKSLSSWAVAFIINKIPCWTLGLHRYWTTFQCRLCNAGKRYVGIVHSCYILVWYN